MRSMIRSLFRRDMKLLWIALVAMTFLLVFLHLIDVFFVRFKLLQAIFLFFKSAKVYVLYVFIVLFFRLA